MLIAEQKLPIEVAEVDGVEVDDVDFAEAGEHKVLEQFAADATSSHHKNACLPPVSDPNAACLCLSRTFLTMPCSVPPRLCCANLSRAIAVTGYGAASVV